MLMLLPLCHTHLPTMCAHTGVHRVTPTGAHTQACMGWHALRVYTCSYAQAYTHHMCTHRHTQTSTYMCTHMQTCTGLHTCIHACCREMLKGHMPKLHLFHKKFPEKCEKQSDVFQPLWEKWRQWTVVERAKSSGSGSSLPRELHKLYSGWLWANELIYKLWLMCYVRWGWICHIWRIRWNKPCKEHNKC